MLKLKLKLEENNELGEVHSSPYASNENTTTTNEKLTQMQLFAGGHASDYHPNEIH